MSQVAPIFKREFLGYFRSPVAYVFLIVFLLASVGLSFFAIVLVLHLPKLRNQVANLFGSLLLGSVRRHALTIGQRVHIRHMHDGMIVEAVDSAVRAVRMTPVRAFEKCPPLAPIAQIDWTRRR